MIAFEQKGLNKMINAVVDAKKGFNGRVKESLEDSKNMCLEYAIGYSPKDTGELAESIYAYDIPGGFIIGADASYAIFNEYGSITTPAGDVNAPLPAKYVGIRPFLRPALYAVKADFPKILGNKLHTLSLFRVAKVMVKEATRIGVRTI